MSATLMCPQSSDPVDTTSPIRTRRLDVIAALVCIAIGLLLNCLPNLMWWVRTGDPAWFFSLDEVISYLWYASHAYHNHPLYLSDPLREGNSPSPYQWLQYVPFVLTAKAANLGPEGISVMWRVWAGLSVPLGWYVLIRQFISRPVLAAALSIFMMTDVGIFLIRPLIRQTDLVDQLLRGDNPFAGRGFGMHGVNYNLRITTPGVTWVFLTAYLALLIRARHNPARPRLLAAGVAFGLLFYAYFYYWTAAGLGLLIGWLADSGRRRTYFHVAWIGGMVGLVAIVSGLLLKQAAVPESLERINMFLKIPRFAGLHFSKRDMLLLAICLVWVWRRQRDLLPLATTAAAGWFLVNHQVLTSLEIQNFHWRYVVYGPLLALLAMLLVTRQLVAICPRATVIAALIVCGLDLAMGIGLRAVEGSVANDPAMVAVGSYHAYRDQRLDRRAEGLAPRSMVAGDEEFLWWASILENTRPLAGHQLYCTATVGHAEWTERHALNGFLRGLSPPEFERETREFFDTFENGPWAYNPVLNEAVVRERLRIFASVQDDPTALLDRYDVRYVALPAEAEPPAYLDSGAWRRLENIPHWQLWERGVGPAGGRERGHDG